MSEILGAGPKSKRVLEQIDKLTAALGPELMILQDVPPEDIKAHSSLLAEAVTRLRRGEVTREAGYDGEYGVIRLFEPGELTRINAVTTPALFDDSLVDDSLVDGALFGASEPISVPSKRTTTVRPEPTPRTETESPQPRPARATRSITTESLNTGSMLDGLDSEQRAAAEVTDGPLLIIAGPGTGKIRTLTHRIAHLVTAHGVAPQQCLAITFTRRAAEEMAARLAALTPEQAPRLAIATFHSLGVRILREKHVRVGLSPNFGIATTIPVMNVEDL